MAVKTLKNGEIQISGPDAPLFPEGTGAWKVYGQFAGGSSLESEFCIETWMIKLNGVLRILLK